MQAASELPFKLKEAEEPAINEQKWIMMTEQEATKAQKQIHKKHEKEMGSPKQVCCRSALLQKESINNKICNFQKEIT